MQLHVRMAPRDPDEAHRASTPLELFFDLTFVVAVAQAADRPAPRAGRGPRRRRPRRLPAGVLRDLVGVDELHLVRVGLRHRRRRLPPRRARADGRACSSWPPASPGSSTAADFGVVVAGYVVMRIGAGGPVAAGGGVASRGPAVRHAATRRASPSCQVFWVARLALPESVGVATFLVLVAAELAVPLWAEAAGRTSWHPRHIAERYGLFTIIVLGEAVLAATHRRPGRPRRPTPPSPTSPPWSSAGC